MGGGGAGKAERKERIRFISTTYYILHTTVGSRTSTGTSATVVQDLDVKSVSSPQKLIDQNYKKNLTAELPSMYIQYVVLCGARKFYCRKSLFVVVVVVVVVYSLFFAALQTPIPPV